MKKKILIASISAVLLIICAIIGYKLYDRYCYSGEFVIIKSDTQSKVYHRIDCPLVKKAISGSVMIAEKEFLARNEYRACKTCNPTYDIKYVLEIRKLKEQEEITRLDKLKQDYLNGDSDGILSESELLSKGYITQNDVNNKNKLEQQKKQISFTDSIKLRENAKQFEDDNKSGKIVNFDVFDYRRIQLGISPMGKYKNPSDEPDWYKNLVKQN